ncbi:hypothetical protein FCV25MIE_34009 [Fagus crenata]
MPNQVVPKTPSTLRSSLESSCFTEVADGNTIECAALCCYYLYVLINLLYMAIYKVLAQLCRHALRNKRSQYLLKERAFATATLAMLM